RAVLQIQALVDQHEQKLTITQSTYKAAIEDSKGAEERLSNLHRIVYPPRWGIKKDLGERYAKMGILTSAAEIFEGLHLWDEVVECYTHAGKKGLAEEVVRRELEKKPTPRMYAALGDITDDEECYKRSWELSGGKYARAMAAMGRMSFDKGEFRKCYDCMVVATRVKPLSPSAWFLLGSVSMRLEEFKTALRAFSCVVQQVPEDCDAWANVAAVHIHNKNPESAYPALCESLRFRRQNWRVWINKLYCCMDLGKWDEAVQAVHTLLDFKTQKSTMKDIPDMDERVVKALVHETVKGLEGCVRGGKGKEDGEYQARVKSCERVGEMLGRISSVVKTEGWVWEAYADFNERMGRGENKVVDCLTKVHRCENAKVWGKGDDEGIERLGPYASKSLLLSHDLMDSSDKRIFVTFPDLDTVADPAVWDPSYWTGEKSFPLISYAHGLNNDADKDYNNLFDDLASWGFVTVAHLACKSGCSDDTTSLWWDPPAFGHYYKQQLLAIDWALDHLEEHGINLDTSRGVGVAGHSMGGQSALFASSYGNVTSTKVSIVASVLHHPFTHEFAAPQVPYISFTGEEDFIAPPSMSKSIFNSTLGPNVMGSRGYVNKVGGKAGHLECEDWEQNLLFSDWYNPLITQFTAAYFKLHLEKKKSEFGVDFEEMIYGGGENSICNGGDGVMEECDVRDGRKSGILADAVNWWGGLSSEEKSLFAAGLAGGGTFVAFLVCIGFACRNNAVKDKVENISK
ncbi:hypothetical protein TrRE_jg6929, partial [Triparma retinervis]